MEGDPFALIEAMTIAGYATGCERGFLYIRGEYPLATRRLRARDRRRPGPRLARRRRARGRLRFDIELRRGAGAYICGEETALLQLARGPPRRAAQQAAVPERGGPVRPADRRSTTSRRSSTCCRSCIDGGAAFAAIGAGRSTGTKLFCVCGRSPRRASTRSTSAPRCASCSGWPAGCRGGAAGGAARRGGGRVRHARTSSTCRSPWRAPARSGRRSGRASSGLRRHGRRAGMLRRIAAFFRDESCGQCVPCRVGTVRQEEALARLARRPQPARRATELALLDDLARVMRDASICGLGQTAPAAVRSALALGLLDAPASPNGRVR